MDEIKLEYEFGDGVCQNRNVLRVISWYEEFSARGSNASSLMMWSRKKNQWMHFTLGWRAIRICCGSSGMIALGADGEVLRAGPSGVVNEVVECDPGGGAATGLLDMALLSGNLFVVGEKGQVYMSEAQGNWANFGEGLKERREKTIRGVSGTDKNDLYVVGDGGFVAHLSGGVWREIEVGIDCDLHRVRAVGSGLAYATSEEGVLVRLDGDKGEVLVHDEAMATLSGMAWFQEKLYLASSKSLFLLTEADELEPVHVAHGPTWTFGHLDANDGVLWSFGKHHLFWTEDGSAWHNATPHATHFDPSESGPAPSHSGSGCCTGGAHHVG